MRTPSRAALTVAIGVFTAAGASSIGLVAANAAPDHSRSSPAHAVSVEVPGTGVDVTDNMDDNGGVTSTTAGTDGVNEVEVDDNGAALGDTDDPAEANDNEDNSTPAPSASPSEHGDNQGDNADDQGDNDNDQNDAGDTDGDHGDDNASPAPSESASSSSDGGGDSSDGGGSGGDDSGSGGGSGD